MTGAIVAGNTPERRLPSHLITNPLTYAALPAKVRDVWAPEVNALQTWSRTAANMDSSSLDTERLAQHRHHGADCGADRVGVGTATGEDNLQARTPVESGPGHLGTVHAGHGEIDQQQVGAASLQRGKALKSVLGFHDVVAVRVATSTTPMAASIRRCRWCSP
jgi:hypothetical protein